MNRKKTKIAVFCSGGGTNLQALLNAQESGTLKSGRICLVLANNPSAYALERAKKAGVPAAVVTRRQTGSQEAFEAEILRLLRENGIELIVLAGFMSILSENFTSRYPKRILNVHPSLIPSFCGKGRRVMEQAEWKILPAACEKVAREIATKGEKYERIRNQ